MVGAEEYSMPWVLEEPKPFTSGSKLVYLGMLGALYHKFLPVRVREILPKGVLSNKEEGRLYPRATSLSLTTVPSNTVHSFSALMAN